MTQSTYPASWNQNIAHISHASFLQSQQWAAFQEQEGRRSIFLENTASGGYQGMMIRMPLAGPWQYWYSPRGPLVHDALGITAFLEQARRKSGAGDLFLRCEPYGVPISEIIETMNAQGARETRAIQPKTSLVVDLKRSLDDIYADMHPKTRYNIRVANRQGVRVVSDGNTSSHISKQLLDLFRETATRNGFSLHPRAYYQRLAKYFAESQTRTSEIPFIRIYTAVHADTLIAGSMVMFFGDTATYLHGASSIAHRALMGPYALHMQALTDAREWGYRWYDFGGIAATDDPDDPWVGITRFKKGFGGQTLSTAGTYDFVFRPFAYALYTGARALWRKRAFGR